MVEAIERRGDVDGCGCLRCRGLDPTVRRRSITGDAVWAVRLLRNRPSIPAFAVGLVVLDAAVGATGSTPAIPIGPVDVPLWDLLAYAALFVLFRGYVAAITTVELNGSAPSVGRELRYVLGRVPAIAGAVAGIWAVVALATVVGIVLSIVAISVDIAFGLGVVRPELFEEGPVAPLAFGSLVVLATFKLWIAPDVSVAGGYGPIEALRTSWSITATHPRRVLAVVLGFVLALFAPGAVTALAERVGATGAIAVPGIELGTAVVQTLAYAVIFAVGTQIYVRAALER